MNVGSSLFLLLIFPRWYPHHLAEQAGEVVGIFNSYFKTNLVYFHVGKVQQLASLLDFQLIEVGEWGVSGTFAEYLSGLLQSAFCLSGLLRGRGTHAGRGNL